MFLRTWFEFQCFFILFSSLKPIKDFRQNRMCFQLFRMVAPLSLFGEHLWTFVGSRIFHWFLFDVQRLLKQEINFAL